MAGSLWAQAPSSDDAIWKQYYDWVQQGDYEANTPPRYRAKLIADGMTEAQADERMQILGRLAQQHRSDLVALFFNHVYTAPETPFNSEPNAFLVTMTSNLKPGTALDVTMGQGRNALYLASKGWQVTGFDIAEKGLEVAQAQAAKRGLHITTIKSDYTDFDFGHEQWDLIVLSYAWVPLASRVLIDRVRDGLKPRGLIVIEHPAEDPGASQDPADGVNALLTAWNVDFRILHYEDTEGQWDWRPRRARVLRLCAEKW